MKGTARWVPWLCTLPMGLGLDVGFFSSAKPCLEDRLGAHPQPQHHLGHPVRGADAAAAAAPHRLGEEMEEDNRTEQWHRSLQAMLDALNQTIHGAILRPSTPHNASTRASRDDNSYLYILFVMTLFAATVGSLILGYTRSRKVDKRSDPYHVYIKNRVSMI